MRRLASIAVLLAVGLACGPQGYQNSPFDTEDPDDNNNGGGEDTHVDTAGGSQGGTNSGGHGGGNHAPRAVAVASPSSNILPGTAVDLDASGSSDIDGDPLAYRWELTKKPAGSTANIANPTYKLASLYIDVPGVYGVLLTVTDNRLEDDAGLNLNVANPNKAPTANAGPDLTVDVGTVVQLSGAASSDPDGDELAYHWDWVTRPPGSVTDLQGAAIPEAAQSVSFVTDMAGTFTVKLEVADLDGAGNEMLRSRADLVNVISRTVSSGGSPVGSHALNQSRTRWPAAWRSSIQPRRSGHFSVSTVLVP